MTQTGGFAVLFIMYALIATHCFTSGSCFCSLASRSRVTTLSRRLLNPRTLVTTASSKNRAYEEDLGKKAKYDQQKVVKQEMFDYAMKVGLHESEAAKALREESGSQPLAVMMGDPIEVSMFGLLLPTMNAKKVLEVGVFTGYATLVMAENLPADGKVVGLDVTREFLLDKHWPEKERSKITMLIGPAIESLQKLCDDPKEVGTYDFSFLDADKVNYDNYYELLLILTRPNGIIAVDNVLWSGKVIDESIQDEDTVALRQISQKIQNDPRVVQVILPFADGVTLVRKL